MTQCAIRVISTHEWEITEDGKTRVLKGAELRKWQAEHDNITVRKMLQGGNAGSGESARDRAVRFFNNRFEAQMAGVIGWR
jgi:dynactin complex subunit